MLYDPKWSKPEVKADPFKLETLIAWLEKQPADSTYCYSDAGVCLLAKHFLAHGFAVVTTGFSNFIHSDGVEDFDRRWHDDIAQPKPHTFGAALKRARMLASR